jgi:hypothetical protein
MFPFASTTSILLHFKNYLKEKERILKTRNLSKQILICRIIIIDFIFIKNFRNDFHR